MKTSDGGFQARIIKLERRIEALEHQREDLKLAFTDCLKSRSEELRRLEQERTRLRKAIKQVLSAYDEAGLSDIGAAVTLHRALARRDE